MKLPIEAIVQLVTVIVQGIASIFSSIFSKKDPPAK